MNDKMNKYFLMVKVADENFKLKRNMLEQHMTSFDECVANGELINADIISHTNSLAKIMHLEDLNAYHMYKQHIIGLLEKQSIIKSELTNIKNMIDGVKDECAALQIEVKKYNHLKDEYMNLKITEQNKKSESELDELWVLNKRHRNN